MIDSSVASCLVLSKLVYKNTDRPEPDLVKIPETIVTWKNSCGKQLHLLPLPPKKRNDAKGGWIQDDGSNIIITGICLVLYSVYFYIHHISFSCPRCELGVTILVSKTEKLRF